MRATKNLTQTTDASAETITDELLDAESTLPLVFPKEKCRPSLRTFDRWRKAKIIPSIKLGSLRYFSPRAVKSALLARQVGGVK
ncbi:MAG: hypothetical protein AAB370_10720 [Verrucomicrobiota bacterium]